jgi:hypothetical protein
MILDLRRPDGIRSKIANVMEGRRDQLVILDLSSPWDCKSRITT